uniref:RNA polymerase beta subunit n=1 Tax=Haramonas pauciplastida TaxID=478668 RepID=UPI0021150C4A|nr:RNA polymerase beta subunit [Haramonas pauciplastida]UTE95006.1 RNA polymerase beta subunit [Haramonas pauciplastida]
MHKHIFISTFSGLAEVQQASFYWFLAHGLSQELGFLSSILNRNGHFEVRFFHQEYILTIFKSQTELSCKIHDTTYEVKIYVPVQVVDRINCKIIKKRLTLIGRIPLITSKNTFIVNGCERVIVSQIIRAPGIYYRIDYEKKKRINHITLIFEYGSWLNFEQNEDGIWLRLDRQERMPIFQFLECLGLTSEEITREVNMYKCVDEKVIEEEPSDDFFELEFLCSRLFDIRHFRLGQFGRKSLNARLGLKIDRSIETITLQDIFAIINSFNQYNIPDKIDSLENRRLRSVGELVRNQFAIGLDRLQRNTEEQVLLIKKRPTKRFALIDPKPIMSTLQEFFGSSQLSHYLDQINPLSELANKRKISALGPGGLSIEHVSLAARDIHPSQYGKICPIETSEGQNVGIVGTLACYARVNKYGFIETPYFQVEGGRILKDKPIIYLNTSEEKNFRIALGDVKTNPDGSFLEKKVIGLYNQEICSFSSDDVNLTMVSPIQMISMAVALVPFLEHNDATRGLMGANMQRQAVPLLDARRPIVGTGLESQIAVDSGLALLCSKEGLVVYTSSEFIVVKDSHLNTIKYPLIKYQSSNQGTCINQKLLVWMGQTVQSGQVLADGAAMENGELALGQNLLVAYMPWEGYNYEDSVLISDKLLYKNILTSIHLETYETEVEETKIGEEKITRDIPQTSEDMLIDLDKNGIIKTGVFVRSGDILVGKTEPNPESDEMPEARLMKALYGNKLPAVIDNSMYVPKGINGRVLSVTISNLDEEELPQLGSLIRITIAQVKKIRIGDKISGRHGNKGVISKILPHSDMPYLPDGRSVDMLLSPLGVPSRMNLGQMFECLLGLAGSELNKRFRILPFDEMYETEASRILINQKLREAAKESKKPWLFNPYHPGKVFLTDGRTGEKFENPILIGTAYMLKLIHIVDHKMHARATGPYSLITQQPIKGRSRHGGQRFGEMEVWALEAFGAAYNLHEILTIKSDDIEGRFEAYNAMIRDKPVPESGIPESFKVLINELQALGLNIRAYRIEKNKEKNIQVVQADLMKTYEEAKAELRRKGRDKETVELLEKLKKSRAEIKKKKLAKSQEKKLAKSQEKKLAKSQEKKSKK